MLGLLGAKKFSNDDLIKELLSPTLNLENLNKIKEKSKIDLNSLYLNSEPILIACCKKDLYNSCLWLLENKIDLICKIKFLFYFEFILIEMNRFEANFALIFIFKLNHLS